MDKKEFMEIFMEGIEQLEDEARAKRRHVLKLKNEWLKMSGWDIQCERIGPTDTYFYRKNDQMLICEDEAIDTEIHEFSRQQKDSQ